MKINHVKKKKSQMVVQQLLNGFYRQYGIPPYKTFRYLKKVSRANGFDLQKPLLRRQKLQQIQIQIQGGVTPVQILELLSLMVTFFVSLMLQKLSRRGPPQILDVASSKEQQLALADVNEAMLGLGSEAEAEAKSSAGLLLLLDKDEEPQAPVVASVPSALAIVASVPSAAVDLVASAPSAAAALVTSASSAASSALSGNLVLASESSEDEDDDASGENEAILQATGSRAIAIVNRSIVVLDQRIVLNKLKVEEVQSVLSEEAAKGVRALAARYQKIVDAAAAQKRLQDSQRGAIAGRKNGGSASGGGLGGGKRKSVRRRKYKVAKKSRSFSSKRR